MADETIKLNNENTIGVTFNNSENNKIIGANVTITGEPTYAGKQLIDGSFNVTRVDDTNGGSTKWTRVAVDGNADAASLVTFNSFTPAAPAVAVDAAGAAVANPAALAATVMNDTTADGSATNAAPAADGSGGGSRKASRRTKNRNSKRRGGRSKRRPRYRSTYR